MHACMHMALASICLDSAYIQCYLSSQWKLQPKGNTVGDAVQGWSQLGSCRAEASVGPGQVG